MKRCQKCGHENSDGMRFCLECGSALHDSPMVINLQDSGQQSSPGGGTPTNFGATRETQKFSGNQPQNFMPQYAAAPAKSKSKIGLIIGGIAALLLLLGMAGAAIVAYNFTRKKTVVVDVKPSPALSPANNNDKSPSPKPSVALKSSPTSNVSQPPQTSFTPPLEPTKKGSFTVNANMGWQLSDLDVVASEQFRTAVQGSIDLGGIKTSVTASGVKDEKTKSRRIYQDFPTGALLMRTRYADGKTSNTVSMTTNGANGSWQNYPYEIGKLEFCINDNAPEQNGGQFIVTKTSTSAPKPKK
jgi:hypothetical protein